MLKLKREVAEHFFGSQTIAEALSSPQPLPRKPEGAKVRIKFYDDATKTNITATVLEITEDEKLRVIEDGANQPIIHVIDPKKISGLFITTFGHELEVSFGVGKVSLDSLVDEYR